MAAESRLLPCSGYVNCRQCGATISRFGVVGGVLTDANGRKINVRIALDYLEGSVHVVV